MPEERNRYKFDRTRRLSGEKAFGAVFDARMKKNAGALAVFSRPNDLARTRLGLSVPRRVGTAVVRNQIKRRLREAFRLGQHDWPPGYDVVVVVRPHKPLALAQYQQLLGAAMMAAHAGWARRSR
jgi:ribonuclease P protein component